mmetsp:Transcript_30512/g.46769  ORF Transcript_30512/g.46769 Transcript_30512/m.46769 type:complete len:96 (+) Transcript_30512:318-605(+)
MIEISNGKRISIKQYYELLNDRDSILSKSKSRSRSRSREDKDTKSNKGSLFSSQISPVRKTRHKKKKLTRNDSPFLRLSDIENSTAHFDQQPSLN